ncbi:hypothetical protein [Variovorax sp. OV329]|uniref:hypothetical protein n=1 Tax=Variovorax sp. OV329 TaxID=1882825 RepID=UPI0008E2EAD0|nr:hypothetical protein [Variovorax sp. OV329]SFL94676.1 hypothetical protein SAMN05444747_101398 [Variovorax sp. OV329]
MKHARGIVTGTAFFAIVLAALLLFAWNRPATMPSGRPGDVWINELASLPREPGTTCDELLDASRGYSNLRLFVNGMDTGVRAVGCKDRPSPTLIFSMRRTRPAGADTHGDDAVWETLIGHPLRSLPDGRSLAYDIQWSKDGKTRHLAKEDAGMVVRIFQWWAPAACILVLYVWWLLVYMAHHTTLLRDAAPAGTPLDQRTYSLGRTQMAWWFAIVFASFVFLWLVTGEMPAISGQALTLLGIASATTMASSAVAPGRESDRGSAGVFFTDLLSDAQGIAIHRFQMVALTIAMGLIFIFEVATRLSMPAFDPSLLTLVGLSSATYVGLKIPEAAARAGPSGNSNPGRPPSGD